MIVTPNEQTKETPAQLVSKLSKKEKEIEVLKLEIARLGKKAQHDEGNLESMPQLSSLKAHIDELFAEIQKKNLKIADLEKEVSKYLANSRKSEVMLSGLYSKEKELNMFKK